MTYKTAHRMLELHSEALCEDETRSWATWKRTETFVGGKMRAEHRAGR